MTTKEIIYRLEYHYQFECPGCPLRNCVEWRQLCDRIILIQDRARDLLKLLPDNLPSSELYAAVDNLAALVPPAPPDAGGL